MESCLRINVEVLVHTLRLALIIQSSWLIIIPIMIVGLENSMPNLRLIRLSSLYHSLFVDSAGRCTMGFMKKGGRNVLNMVRLVSFKGIVLLGLLCGKIRFL